ncbi:WXG100 family type VII secretion target [Knoellia remsis]|uniref:ESAT-6-like protein n=1 Tax=Knoellia remsis TaxID=407159 RepID=A0A2T0UEG0_9MICO|nr:WXG100 family type VII secretion target [Knoellia remsis]PRY56309.1 WXG100 family type VII secretion target [Knoellia remsis]
MGNQNFSVGAGAITKSAEIVDTARTDLKSKLKDLQGQMEQVKAHWEGAGAGAFQNVQVAWTTQAQDLVDILDRFRENLVANDKQYTADDQASSDLLSKYTSQMGGK